MLEADSADLDDFVSRYLPDELNRMARTWPDEPVLRVDWRDIFQYDTELAEVDGEHLAADIGDAVSGRRVPGVTDLDGLIVAVTYPPDRQVDVCDITDDHTGDYMAVRGRVTTVHKRQPRYESITFECAVCGHRCEVPQTEYDFGEPSRCEGCDRQTPQEVVYDDSTSTMERWVTIKTLPDADTDTQETIQVRIPQPMDARTTAEYVGDLAGDEVVVHGTIEVDEGSLRDGAPTFVQYIDAVTIDPIDTGVTDRELREYESAVRDIVTDSDDPVQTFADSIAPSITRTDELSGVFDMATAYLFGAPRGYHDGKHHRGDIHMALVGDPGTAKSVIASAIAEISPRCEHRSATGFASGVGLTASANRDERTGEWQLKPGVLVRANGGHAIIEEVDKANIDLTQMNDAIEGEQVYTADKAGLNSTLQTRCGVFITANPEDGRFDHSRDYAEQFNIDPSLMSRFDVWAAIPDVADEDQDSAIAGSVLSTWQSMLADADDATDELHTRLKVWVYLGRQLTPSLPDEAAEILQSYYVEARDMNDGHGPVSATARQLEAGIRLATAFARCRLSETISVSDAQRAVAVTKHVLGQTHDGMTGQFDVDYLTEAQPQTQKGRRERITAFIREEGEATVDGIADGTRYDRQTIEHDVEKLKQNGEIYEPERGLYRLA